MAETPKVKKVKELKRLKYEFNGLEREELGSTLATAVSRKSGLEDEKKSVVSQIGSQINGENFIINEASEKLRSGYEYRPIQVEVTYDYKTGTVEITRLDTKEQVEMRDMRADERQMELSKAPEKK